MEEAQCLESSYWMVRKTNDLIRKSLFNISLQQQKILFYLISLISPYDDDYEFSIPEFCSVCGIVSDSGKNYSDLKTAVKDIADKSLWVTMANGDETLMRCIKKATTTSGSGSGIITFRIDDDMKPFLLHLKENFTQHEIAYTLHFKSKYTIRLHELIKSVHCHELTEYKCQYGIADLQRMLDAEIYTEYRDFKRRVLLPSMEEINEYSDKTISMEELRRGRKVLSVEFSIGSKDSLDAIPG